MCKQKLGNLRTVYSLAHYFTFVYYQVNRMTHGKYMLGMNYFIHIQGVTPEIREEMYLGRHLECHVLLLVLNQHKFQ